MREKFIEPNFRNDTLTAIAVANDIIAAYSKQGYKLTLRQIYYQHVARALIENSERSYKNLGEIINKGRLAGLIDWDSIEDRTRSLRGLSHWESPADIIYSAANSFRIDKWAQQPNRVEIWVEKDALVNILERVCTRWDVPFFSCRGYASQSEMYDAAKRIQRYIQHVRILHLGDHDPSGIDMTRDIRDRLQLLTGKTVEVTRLALNWAQIEQHRLPPNPAKSSDARFRQYATKYGTKSSWELDALEPSLIEGLIEASIKQSMNDVKWATAIAKEKSQRTKLQLVAMQWESLTKKLRS